MIVGVITDIKTLDDNSLECTVDAGLGLIVACPLTQAPNTFGYPVEGDEVVISKIADEWNIITLYRGYDGASAGELVLFARSSSGVITGTIHLKTNGTIDINDGNLQVLA